jgi:NADH:ubiquinone oxidoreductase subunit F (NADH-binding)
VVLLGGYGGTWARWEDVAGLSVDEAAVRRHGLTLGAGIVAPLADGSCGVAITAAIAGYLARVSAGQCGPCLFGLPALAGRLDRLARGRARRSELARLGTDLDAVDGRGACHHPDGAVRLVRSALAVFGDDYAAHARGRPCGGSAAYIPLPAT